MRCHLWGRMESDTTEATQQQQPCLGPSCSVLASDFVCLFKRTLYFLKNLIFFEVLEKACETGHSSLSRLFIFSFLDF